MATLRLGRIVGSDLFGFFSHHLDLQEDEIAKHKHILGIAGAGKSKLLEAMWLSLHRQGIGATFLDPQGSSAEFLLRALVGQGFYAKHPAAYDRVIYLEFADGEWMIPFNILRLPFASTYERVKLVVEAFKRVWPELATAPMFDTMMDASLKILIDNDVSLAALPELLADKDKRLTTYYPHAKDELALSWFRTQWDRLPPRDQLIQGGTAIRRAYLLVSSPVAQLTLGQRENVLDFRAILDREQSVIINLGRVRDGETRKLLGAILTHSYEVAALSRLPRTDLPHHHLLIDEFAQFAAQSGEALATMLDQTRKAGLFATLAGQTYSQLTAINHASDRLIGALANAMVKISFLVGPQDALTQARIFADIDPVAVKKDAAFERGQPLLMTPNDQYEAWAQTLKTLEPRHALVRVGTKKAVEIETTPVPTYAVTQDQIDAVKHGYFERYYTRRADVVLPHQAPWNQGKPAQRVTP